MRGEKIYEYDVDMTGTIDFGVELAHILEGKASIPPQGARFDVGFDGRSTGRIAGRLSGTDFAYMRPDGCIELNIRGVIETDDGKRIALQAGGVGVLRSDAPILDLTETVRLLTAAPDYDWVNARQILAVGTADLATGKIHLEGFLQ
ncbi:DUF3237 family protein [Aquisediminimonas profunda]|uniref:DUF3237 family protein n=1 Tax=Aquisediminimonas profunda TaxID=1550733 RepID=UPI001C62E7EC|nr:DUF3237 family protein [Aquisediminimonas profunda]